VRLAIAVALSLAVVGVMGYGLMSRDIEQRIIGAHVAEQRADAGSFAAVSSGSDSRATIVAEVRDLIHAIHRRPNTLETLLIDERGVVQAAGDDAVVGEIDLDSRISAALHDGIAYAGREADSARDTRDLEFVMPLELGGRPYAYELTLDHRNLDHQLREARRSLLLVALLSLLVGGGAFYLAGGRSLLRSHRLALHRATRDGLTDLPNQRAFHDDLPRAVQSAVRHGDPLVLLLLDVDEFKSINDRHGHPHGDELLRRVAAVLREGRSGDLSYRIGGDEFAVLMPRTSAEGARSRGRRLSRVLRESNTAVSVGIAELLPGATADLLRRETDAALYEAKRRGGNGVVHFDDIRGDVVVTTADKLDAVHRLLEDQRMEVAYQPIWDLRSNTLLGLEALARPHADYGFAGPAEAFDLAEQIGRVPQLDKLCVATALRASPELPDDALLFLNLAPQTLDSSGVDEDWLLCAVNAAGLSPGRVVIEVTERFGGRTTAVIKSLRLLRAQGFKVALDDVGTGNSGLEMLRLVDAEFVKLDRSIISSAPEEPNARAVLMAMATYARQTGAFVIAEGIEDNELLDFVRSVDDSELRGETIIQGGQGYGLGRPSAEIPASGATLSHSFVGG
jgi:diguanylate cyclase (GGDEF)-like protein